VTRRDREPRSALNLRLSLALVGLVGCGVLAVALFWVGYPVAGWIAAAVALLAAGNAAFVQYRRVQRDRREPGGHDSPFE
jgi:uncharacterized membrane protein YqjE